MAIQITLKGQSQAGDATTSLQSGDYSNAAAALAAISNGFLPVPNPMYPGGIGQPGTDINVANIEAIITIPAVTFGTVPEEG